MEFESTEMGGFTFYFPPNETAERWSNENVIDGVINGGYYGRDLHGTVVDIGANVGSFTVLAAQTAERVIAYEPDPRNVACLRKNVKANNLTNVTIHELGVGTPGPRTFNVNLTNCGHSNLYFEGENTRQETVRCVSLRDVFEHNKLNTIDVLKCDCEGAEWEFLFNDEALLENVDNILMEAHFYQPDQTLDRMKRFLSKRFTIQDIGQTTDTAFILRAHKK